MNIKEEVLRVLAGLAVSGVLDILIPSVDRILISVSGFATVWLVSKLASMTSDEARTVVFWGLAMLTGMASVFFGTWIFYGYSTFPIMEGIPFQLWGMGMIVLSWLSLSFRSKPNRIRGHW